MIKRTSRPFRCQHISLQSVNEQVDHVIYKSEQRLVDGWIVYIYAATFGNALLLVGAVDYKEEWDVCDALLDDEMADLTIVGARSWNF